MSSGNPRMRAWHGQRVWVVGASSGIGQAVTQALLERGALVHISARSRPALEAMAAQWPNAKAVPLDVCVAPDVRAAALAILEQGPLDLVLYCAGHYRPMRATGFDLDEMLKHQQINYAGALHVLAAVLPAMLERHAGHISLVASVAGYRGLPQGLAYGPTKAALIHLAETLHFDLQPQGLGVSVVNPGFVETPLTAQNSFAMPALITPAEAAREMLDGWARGRFEIHFPRRFSWPMKMVSLLPFGLYQAVVRRATGL